MGMVLGVLLAIVIIVLFFVYGLPALRGNRAPDNGKIDVNVELPGGSNNGGGTAPSGSGGGGAYQ